MEMKQLPYNTKNIHIYILDILWCKSSILPGIMVYFKSWIILDF